MMEKMTRQQLFGRTTTPREFKKGARDIPFGMGAKSLYVGGTNAHASNDGESWVTAMATIQAAVDAAGVWTNIYIKAGTYAEAVTIDSQKINLVGERRASVIIAPASGVALTINVDYCNASHLTAQTTVGDNSIAITGDRNLLHYVAVQNKNLHCYGDFNEIRQVRINTAVPDAISIAGTYAKVHHCLIDGAYIGILAGNADYCEIYENEIKNCSVTGIRLQAAASNNSIYHNNLINNATQVEDAGSSNEWFENFYDDHTTDSDFTGCADTAYAFTTGNDRHPCSSRNAWKRRTLGLVLT